MEKTQEMKEGTILDKIIEGIRIVKIENRDIKKIILGTESLTELQMSTLDMMYEGEIAHTMKRKLLGYPIKILSFLPHNYIGLEL